MEDSILLTIKKLLGVGDDDDSFDVDLITHINSVFGVLWQLGVGPYEGYEITDATNVWSEFLPDRKYLNTVKTYISLKVKKIFDPPQSSSVMEALTNVINEYECQCRHHRVSGQPRKYCRTYRNHSCRLCRREHKQRL